SPTSATTVGWSSRRLVWRCRKSPPRPKFGGGCTRMKSRWPAMRCASCSRKWPRGQPHKPRGGPLSTFEKLHRMLLRRQWPPAPLLIERPESRLPRASALLRSHTCGQLRKSDVGSDATLCGWVESKRDHGGAVFIDLRDRYGVTQIVIGPPEAS